jgi:hypothetical protein
MMLDLLVMKPRYTWPGLLIAVSGIPLYWLTQLAGTRSESTLNPTPLDDIADNAGDQDR